VEAKRKRKNVQAAIDQAGRYAQGFLSEAGIELPAGGFFPVDGTHFFSNRRVEGHAVQIASVTTFHFVRACLLSV
jgi:hypothetical protein